MTPNEKYAKEIMSAFQTAKGKGYCFCINPILPYKLVAQTAIGISSKDESRKILIVTPYYDVTNKIKGELIKIDDKEHTNISYLTKLYVNPKYNYNYDCTIVVGINGEDSIDLELLRKLDSCSKFTLFIFTINSLPNDINLFLTKHSNFLKTTVTPNEARMAYLYSPVEEWRCGVELSETDREEYDKANQYIADCISIFGDLKTIEKCARGDKLLNISASEFRYNFAIENGWNEHLNMNSDYEKSIDEIYNPNTLNEKANTFYTITHKRKEIAINNDNKLIEIGKIVRENYDKKICIVSKSGEMALAIANYLNGEEFAELNIKCGQYHDCIPETYGIDDEGNILIRKSGKDKGKPVILKSQASSTQYERLYNFDIINIMSIKFASNVKLKISFDLIIFTDCLTANIIDFKSRFINSYCNSLPNKVYRLYSTNTIEEKSLNSENIMSNVQIMSHIEEKFIFD